MDVLLFPCSGVQQVPVVVMRDQMPLLAPGDGFTLAPVGDRRVGCFLLPVAFRIAYQSHIRLRKLAIKNGFSLFDIPVLF